MARTTGAGIAIALAVRCRRRVVSVPMPVAFTEVDVLPGNRIHVVLSTLADFPIDRLGPAPLKDVRFSPADGDGLVDVVQESGVLLNQHRSATRTGFAFAPQVTGESLATTPAPTDGDQQRLEDSIRSQLEPSDVVLEWIAPYIGRVDVSGVLSFVERARPSPTPPEADGVRVQIFVWNLPQRDRMDRRDRRGRAEGARREAKSPVTELGGPSAPLREALEEAGIKKLLEH